MNDQRLRQTALMHSVLDGEASASEVRELEALLADDPALRAEYDDWKRLFLALDAMPREHAPEGLVAATIAALPLAGARDSSAAGQPFPRRRVFGRTLSGFLRPNLQHSRAIEPSGIASATPTRSVSMAEQSHRIMGQRKAWLGAGIAAAAALAVAQFGFDFPVAKDVTGAVVPAERYRAAPNGSEDVKLVAPLATPGKSVGADTAAEASRSAAERSQSQKTADLTLQRTDAQKTADLTMQRTDAQKTADLTMQRTDAQKTADLTMQRTDAQKTADLAMQRTDAQKTADLTMQRVDAQKTADRARVDRTADRAAAEKTLQRAESARVESQRTMDKSANRSTSQ